MSHRRHDVVCWLYARQLLRQGARVATEVGIPGGRIDVVTLDAADRWVGLHEIKTNYPAAGVDQLKRYAEIVGGDPSLTLVVSPDVHSAELASQAASAGVHYEVFAMQESRIDDSDPGFVRLPHLHPSSVDEAARKRDEWFASHKLDVKMGRWVRREVAA